MEIQGKPSNGKWGWMVTFVCFMVGIIMDGISYSFGILFHELLLHFEQEKSLTSWIISVYNAATLIIGPVASILISRYGEQKVSVCGSLLASIAVFLSTFSPNVYVMILLFGLIGGSGLGAIYFSSIVMISQYFTSKRGLASGLAFCGSGVGTFIFAPLMEFLITRYTWQGAIWIVSAIILNCVPLGALLRPLYKKETNNADDRNIHQSGNINSDSKISNNTFNCNHITLHILELLKSPLLILYGASCFLCNLGFYIPFIYLPDCVEDMGMTSQDSAILLVIVGSTNTVGRVIAGNLIDRSWMDPIKLNMGSLLAGGVTSAFVPNYTKFAQLSVFCALFGFMTAVFVTCQPIISLELSERGKMSLFFGIICLFKSVAALTGAPLAGMLADMTGNYVEVFYMTGVTISTAGILCLPLICLHRRNLVNKQQKEDLIDININDIESTYL